MSHFFKMAKNFIVTFISYSSVKIHMLVAMVQLLTVQLTVILMVFQILLLLQCMLLSVSILVLPCTVPMIHALISITPNKLLQSVIILVSVYNIVHSCKNMVKTEDNMLCSGLSL